MENGGMRISPGKKHRPSIPKPCLNPKEIGYDEIIRWTPGASREEWLTARTELLKSREGVDTSQRPGGDATGGIAGVNVPDGARGIPIGYGIPSN